MPSIDYDGRRFRSVSNSETGEVGADDPLLFGSQLAAQYATMRAAHELTDEQLAELARMSVRASRLSPSCTAVRKDAPSSRIAFSDHMSAIGLDPQ